MHLGERIRKLRKDRKMTLVELSSQTGVAQASLSRIETGIMKGTVESHQKISEALGMNISELYSDLDSKLAQIEMRADNTIRQEAVIKNNSVRVELLTSQLNIRKFAPALITIPAGAFLMFEKLERETDKFFWVQNGKITVNLNKKDYEPGANDTLYFDASYAHSITNTSSSEAKILSITSPATF